MCTHKRIGILIGGWLLVGSLACSSANGNDANDTASDTQVEVPGTEYSIDTADTETEKNDSDTLLDTETEKGTENVEDTEALSGPVMTVADALLDTDAQMIVAKFTSVCKQTMTDLKECTGYSMFSTKCKSENWEETFQFSSLQAFKNCWTAKTAEHECAEQMICQNYVDWYNNDILGSCEIQYNNATDACGSEVVNAPWVPR